MKQSWHMFWVMLFFLLFSLVYVSCQAAEIDMDIIAQIESSNNPNAVSFRGARYGRGKYQVSEVALQDYNTHNRTEIAPEELFCPEVNHRVATWYIGQIRRYLKHFKIEATTENILWAYNAGIGRVVKGIKPDETKEYIRKYQRLNQEAL